MTFKTKQRFRRIGPRISGTNPITKLLLRQIVITSRYFMLHHFPLHRVTLQVFTSLYFILHYLVTLLYITTSQYVSLKIAPFSQLHLPCFVRSHPRAHPEVRLLTAEIRFGRTHAAGFVGKVWVYL